MVFKLNSRALGQHLRFPAAVQSAQRSSTGMRELSFDLKSDETYGYNSLTSDVKLFSLVKWPRVEALENWQNSSLFLGPNSQFVSCKA